VTPVALLPGAPLNVKVVVVSHAEVIIYWSPPSTSLLVFGGDGGRPITKYVVEWDSPTFSALGVPPANSIETSGFARSYTIGSRNVTTGNELPVLLSATVYSVRVSAYNSIGFGPPGYPEPANVTTGDRVPWAPQSLTATDAGSGQVVLHWDTPERDGGATLTRFLVNYDTDPSFGSLPPSSGFLDIPVIHEQQLITISAAPPYIGVFIAALNP
jgi:hypothetical protein